MHKAKSVIIGRKKSGEDGYCVLINLFDVDDPHLSTDSPLESFEYYEKELLVEDSGSFKFLPTGNDIVMNSISGVDLREEDETVVLKVHR